jgi:hypothetical protein
MRIRLLCFFLIFSSGKLWSQRAPEAQQIRQLKDSFSVQEWKSFIESAKNVRLVFGGENHREVDFNSLVEFQVMRLLHHHAGYQNYLIELSPARAHYLNRFIRYGDQRAENAIKGIASPKYMKLFDNLYRWNQQLPLEQRIHIHGIDVERFEDLSVLRLAECFDSALKVQDPDPKILPQILAFVDFAERKYKERLAYFNSRVSDTSSNNEGVNEEEYEPPYYYAFKVDDFVDSLNANIMLYDSWISAARLSKEYRESVSGVLEVNKWEKLDKTPAQYLWRENTMYNRLKVILKENPNERFFGQFGRCHISLSPSNLDCGWYNYKSVLNQTITELFGSSDSVVNIGYLYMGRGDDVHSEDWKETAQIEQEINILKNQVHDGMVLYDLNENGSSLPNLRKKYKFILVNHAKSVKLSNALEASAYEQPTPDNPVDVYFDYFGVEVFPDFQMPLMSHYQAIAGGNSFDMQRTLLGLRHDIHIGKGSLIGGFGGYYTLVDENLDEEAFWVDSTGKHFYTHWGLDVKLGLRTKATRWHAHVMGRLGYSESQIRYRAFSKDPLNPAEVKELDITNGTWSTGGVAQIGYTLSKELMFFIRGTYYRNIDNGMWRYKGSSMPYFNGIYSLGSQEYWSLSAHLSLYISD